MTTTYTSMAAYHSMLSHIPQIKARVAAYISLQGERGATCEEIEMALHLKHQTASATINALKKGDDPVIKFGRLYRWTTSKRKAMVWVLAKYATIPPPPSSSSTDSKTHSLASTSSPSATTPSVQVIGRG